MPGGALDSHEDSVTAAAREAHEELAARAVRMRAASHRQRAGLMRSLVELRLHLPTRTTGACALRAATLDHEARHDAVEAGARSFDFSGLTAQSRGVVMDDFTIGSSQETLRIEGSQAIEGDVFKGGLFNTVINGNGGNDELIGSELGASSTFNDAAIRSS